MNLSLSVARTSALAQVSRFITWHQRHHQDCSDMITNFFSRAAFVKVASFHSLQKPSLLSIGAECAAPANKSESNNARIRIIGAPGNRRDTEYWQIVLSARTHSVVSYSRRRLCPTQG